MSSRVFWALLAVQVATYIILGALMVRDGDYRLGSAQLLLAVVQAVIYSAGAPV